jgi:hypothetical protein
MLNNLTNYPDLIRLKAIVDVPQDTDLITLGVRNPNYDGNYRPALNTYRDFADSILAQVPVPVPGLTDVNAAYTLFVDLVYGNDGTAEVDSLAKPYKTIAAATAAAVALGSSIPILIHLRPGQYNEGMVFRNNVYYYADKGVVFYTMGAYDTFSDQQAVSGLFGYAKFRASANIQLNYGCTITMEFDSVDTTALFGFFQITNSQLTYNPNINITCNSLKTDGTNGYGCTTRGKVNLTVNVKEFIRSPYNVFDVRGQAGTPYTGNLTINCPKIVIEDGGVYGNNAAYKTCYVSTAISSTSIVTINGNLYNEVSNTTFIGSLSACISDWSSSPNYILRFNGNIYAGTQRAILNNTGSRQFIEGNISTTSIVASVNAGNTQIKNSTIVRGDSTDANAIIGVGAANLYLNDCTIYNGDSLGASNTIRLTSASSRVYANNIVCQQAASSDYFMGGIVGSSAGMINVQSNRSNNSITSLYTATGYTQEANLRVPQYI